MFRYHPFFCRNICIDVLYIIAKLTTLVLFLYYDRIICTLTDFYVENGEILVKKFTRKSVYSMFFISYLVVLILPLFISQLFYWTSLSAIKNSTLKLNRISLMQTASSIDQMFLDIRSTGQQLLSMEEVSSLTYAQLPLNTIKRLKIASFQKILRERIAYSQYLESIYVYFDNLEYVASTEGFLSLDSFLNELEKKFNTDRNTFFQWIDSNTNFQVKMLSEPGASPQNASKIMVIMTTASYNGRPDVSIVFTVNTKTIKTILNNYNIGSSEGNPYICVLSESDDLMIHQGLSPEHKELMSPILKLQKEKNITHSIQKGFVIMKAHSDVSGWSLISAISIQQYASQLRNIQMYYIVFIILCVSIGLAISLYFSYKNYNPVKRLTELAGGSPSDLAELDEFSFVEKSLTNLLNNKMEYIKKIDKQKSELKQINLVRMLHGSIYSNQAFDRICADYDINFSTNQFLIIGIIIKDYSNLFFEKATTDDEETTELVYFIVTSITEELVREKYDAYICRDEGNLYCIASLKEPASGDKLKLHTNKVMQICEKCEAIIREKFGIILSYYVSNIYSDKNNDIKSISQGYQEIQWGFAQIESFNLSNPVLNDKCLMESIASIENNRDLSPVKIKRVQLYNAIFSGNIEDAIKIYRELVNEGISLTDKSFSTMRMNSIIILDFCLSHMEPKLMQSISGEISKLINNINNARNMDTLTESMKKVFEYIYQIHEQEYQNESSKNLFTDISNYIQDNIANPNLSVASIADHFNISQAYLLRVFKNETGSGVLDYIHQCRIDIAKDLLKNTSYTVKEIAVEVGYTNALTFMRAFKRLEGITPTNYRDMIN